MPAESGDDKSRQIYGAGVCSVEVFFPFTARRQQNASASRAARTDEDQAMKWLSISSILVRVTSTSVQVVKNM